MKLWLCFLIAIAAGTSSFAFAQEEPGLADIDLKLTRLETKIAQLQSGLGRIAQKQTQIDQELGSLKMWIRRHRG